MFPPLQQSLDFLSSLMTDLTTRGSTLLTGPLYIIAFFFVTVYNIYNFESVPARPLNPPEAPYVYVIKNQAAYLQVCKSQNVVGNMFEPLRQHSCVITVHYSGTCTIQASHFKRIRPQLVGAEDVSCYIRHHQGNCKQSRE